MMVVMMMMVIIDNLHVSMVWQGLVSLAIRRLRRRGVLIVIRFSLCFLT